MLNKVSQSAVDAAFSRLSHATTGFNPTFATAAAVYGIPTNFVSFDFTDASQNFWFGQINPDLLEQTAIFKYPLACMYIQESGQTGTQKFNQFSGVVRVIVEVYLSWKEIKGKHNFEKYCSCVEDTMIDVFNRVENQDWSYPVVYNGGIQCRRGPLSFAAENFRQRVAFSLLFEVHR